MHAVNKKMTVPQPINKSILWDIFQQWESKGKIPTNSLDKSISPFTMNYLPPFFLSFGMLDLLFKINVILSTLKIFSNI